jgi:hypothetical protein
VVGDILSKRPSAAERLSGAGRSIASAKLGRACVTTLAENAVDRPGAAQSEVRVAMRSLRGRPRLPRPRCSIPFSAEASEANLNLREDKGYTYGAFLDTLRHRPERALGSAPVESSVTREDQEMLRSRGPPPVAPTGDVGGL